MSEVFQPDEVALLAAIHASPKDGLVPLVYADWLDDHDRAEQAEFLRLGATAPVVLVDGDSEAERTELARCLDIRGRLRIRRAGLDKAWLKAIRDPGLLGEVVADTKWHFPMFGVIVKETRTTVVVAGLLRRKLEPRDGAYGPERPILPTEEDVAGLVAAAVGDRCKKLDGWFRNERRGCVYHFWEGRTEYYYPD